ncbi:glutamyl aminopeptidase-like [Physella acuta]|uniref:glutamyl aminopeptidase-like n=1 Tax=Physella acuta TaxID=109671 RepID=UPI0027DB0667|nr:glutamyl aminopeptidase-like [Physella acuta]
MGGNQNKKLKCCLAVVVIISVIAAVAVGAVVWKLTKDAYASSTGTKALASGNGSVDGQVESTTSSTQQPTRRTYTAEEIKEKPWLSTRLPRDVIPVHYDVTLFPNFYDGFGEFSGNSTIEVNVTSPTRYILLHVHTTYMNVTGTHVTDNTTGDEIDVIRTFYHTPHEFFVIQVGRDVMGFVKLTLQFQGTLNKTLVGFYKSSYLNTLNGQTRNLAASKFEPTYARRAFPCFDEPNIKAEFTITLIHRPEYIALSNMPQVGNESVKEFNLNAKVRHRYKDSP